MKKNNNLCFWRFEVIDWNSVFARFYIEIESGQRFSFAKEIGKLLIDLFKTNQKSSYSDNNSRILFFISRNERKSINDTFESVRALNNSDILEYNNQEGHCCILQSLYYLFTAIPIWFFQICKMKLTLGQRLNLVRSLYNLDLLFNEIKSIDINRYNLLVTYYDSWMPEAFMVQLFRSKGKKTVSLQHGQFTSKGGEKLIDSGVELRSFNSDYLLCWNKYTYDEAIKSGISSDKLVIAGIWTYINKERVLCNKNRNGVFGVVIGHPSFEEENNVLIESANMLSEKYNLDYYLKLHPIFKEDAFANVVNTHYKGNIKKGISMIDYANQVDFSLIGSTSVFVELVYIGHDIYRYSSGETNDKYKSVEIGKFFKNVEDLSVVFDRERNNDYTEQLFDYLCSVSDVTSEYRRFFEQFK